MSIVIGIFSVLHISSYLVSTRIIKDNAITYSELLAENISSSIDDRINELDRLAQNVLLDKDVLNGLTDNIIETLQNHTAISSTITGVLNLRVDIDRVLISNLQGDIVTGGPNAYHNINNNINDKIWFQDFMNSKEMFYVIAPHKNNAGKVISVLRKLRTFPDLEVCGLIRLDMKAEILDDICNEKQLDGHTVLIFDDEKNLSYSVGEKLNDAMVRQIANGLGEMDGTFSIHTGQEKQYVSYVESEYSGLYVAFIIPEAELFADINKLNTVFTLLGTLCVGAALFMAFAYATKMKKGVDSILKGMRGIEEGAMDTVVSVNSEDEIGKIANGLNHMVKRIKILMHQNARMEVMKKESEMLMLQSQIDPHFLYNTLDGIRMKAIINKDGDTAYMIEQLSSLLKKSADIKSGYIRFSDEVEYVQNYITLQNLRFRYKFELHVEVEDRVLELIVLKFILQPLIENSVKHGLEMKKSDKEIYVKSIIDEKEAKIIVSDTGIGISKVRLQEIRDSLLQTGLSKSIGLCNINSRLKLYYGEECGLTIESEEGQGTIVTLHILPSDKVSKLEVYLESIGDSSKS